MMIFSSSIHCYHYKLHFIHDDHRLNEKCLYGLIILWKLNDNEKLST